MKLNLKNNKSGNLTGNKTRIEHALRASERSYCRLFEAAKDGRTGNLCQHIFQ